MRLLSDRDARWLPLLGASTSCSRLRLLSSIGLQRAVAAATWEGHSNYTRRVDEQMSPPSSHSLASKYPANNNSAETLWTLRMIADMRCLISRGGYAASETV